MLGDWLFGGIFIFLINLIGGTIRWGFGTLYRRIFKKKLFTYSEYLYGPKKSKDFWDRQQVFGNGIVAFFVLFIIFFFLV